MNSIQKEHKAEEKVKSSLIYSVGLDVKSVVYNDKSPDGYDQFIVRLRDGECVAETRLAKLIAAWKVKLIWTDVGNVMLTLEAKSK
jgi:hypothetical protein